jgi:hypothetical protein
VSEEILEGSAIAEDWPSPPGVSRGLSRLPMQPPCDRIRDSTAAGA